MLNSLFCHVFFHSGILKMFEGRAHRSLLSQAATNTATIPAQKPADSSPSPEPVAWL